MSLEHELLFMLYAVHCMDGCRWVRSREVAFREDGLGALRLQPPTGWFANALGWLHVALPWWSLRATVLCPMPRWGLNRHQAMSPGMDDPFLEVPREQARAIVEMDQVMEFSAEGDQVLADEQPFLRGVRGEPLAVEVQRLRQAAEAAPALRESYLETLRAASLDAAQAQEQLERVQRALQPMLWMARIQWVFLYAVVPVCVLQMGFLASLPGLILALGVVGICATAVHLWVCRAEALRSVPWRRARALLHLLAPPLALRVRDHFLVHAVAAFHPLAVARATCPPAQYRALAEGWWRSLRFPRLGDGEGHAELREAVAWELGVLERWFGEGARALHASDLAVPPSASGRRCARCAAEFLPTTVRCGDCDLPLAGSSAPN